MRTQVIIDADFLNIFLSFKDGEILFKDIMESLGFSLSYTNMWPTMN